PPIQPPHSFPTRRSSDLTFHDTCVNAHTIANGEWRSIAFLLFVLNDVDDAVHKPVQPRGCGRTLSFGGVDFATRIPAAQDRRELDRKSTRLNSSHVSISY